MTKNEEILKKFMIDGGWKVLNKWISEAKDTDNEPILGEILKVSGVYQFSSTSTPWSLL